MSAGVAGTDETKQKEKQMSYTNYRQMENKVLAREEFNGNSASAGWGSNGVYWVYSYGTPIATFDSNRLEYWVSDSYYSNTTSRLQNLVRRAWGLKK